MEQAPNREEPRLSHNTILGPETTREDYMWSVDEIEEPLRLFLEGSTKCQPVHGSQPDRSLPIIDSTTYKLANQFVISLEAILTPWGYSFAPIKPGDFDYPYRVAQKHYSSRFGWQPGQPWNEDDLRRACIERFWIRGATTLRVAQEHLTFRLFRSRLMEEKPVIITKEEMIQALQNCIWIFLAQGHIVKFVVGGPAGMGAPLVLDDTNPKRPDLDDLLERWENGRLLAELICYKKFRPKLIPL